VISAKALALPAHEQGPAQPKSQSKDVEPGQQIDVTKIFVVYWSERVAVSAGGPVVPLDPAVTFWDLDQLPSGLGVGPWPHSVALKAYYPLHE